MAIGFTFVTSTNASTLSRIILLPQLLQWTKRQQPRSEKTEACNAAGWRFQPFFQPFDISAFFLSAMRRWERQHVDLFSLQPPVVLLSNEGSAQGVQQRFLNDLRCRSVKKIQKDWPAVRRLRRVKDIIATRLAIGNALGPFKSVKKWMQTWHEKPRRQKSQQNV